MPGGKSQARTKRPTVAGTSAASKKPQAKPAANKAAAKPAAKKAPAKPKAAGGSAESVRTSQAAKPAKTAARVRPTTAGQPAAVARKRPAARPASPVRSNAARQHLAVVSASPIDRLHQVALVATDLGAAVAFYRDVIGLPFVARFDPPGLAFFDLGGGIRLMLSATASSATLYFHVKDVDAAFKALSGRGVRFLHKPSLVHRDDEGLFGKKGLAEWMAFFRDPSGNLLALVARR